MQVDNCTRTASRYANWYGMNVETMKSNIQVVIMRLLGELAAKAGAVDLPLLQSIRRKTMKAGKGYTPYVLDPHPHRSSRQVFVW